jgi:hypothetical protein
MKGREIGENHKGGEIEHLDLPLNSNKRRERALILALIMCGVAAVKPAATIVTYSSALACTDSVYQLLRPVLGFASFAKDKSEKAV